MKEKKKRKCNKCGNKYSDMHFKNAKKKTCRYCEFRWWRTILRSMVKDRKLSPVERIANRLGYMGAGFIMISPYLLPYGDIGAITYIIGGLLSTPQVFVAKQWNLVVVNLNVTVGYLIYLMNFYGII
jgi:hypothetical protein